MTVNPEAMPPRNDFIDAERAIVLMESAMFHLSRTREQTTNQNAHQVETAQTLLQHAINAAAGKPSSRTVDETPKVVALQWQGSDGAVKSAQYVVRKTN